MKKFLLLMFVLCIIKPGYAGNRYTYALTSGNPFITASSVSPGLQHGDTLDIPANAVYTSFTVSNLNGLAGDSIVIRWLPGARITNNISYAIGEWTNVSYVKVIGLNSQNNGSTAIALRAGCHSIRFTQCNFSNDLGRYSVQPVFVADDKYGSSMYFTGAKSQTFYDIRIDASTFNGFLDVEAIGAGTDTTRSVCLDFEIDHNTFKNMTQDVKIVPNAMSVTGYNFKIHDNKFDSLAYNTGACHCSHNSWITIYGNGDINNNQFSHTYGNDMRIVPMKFSGLAGYDGPINVYNNISTWHDSYSFLETSPNNGYGRASTNGGYVSFTDTRIYFNTVYRTNRASNNGDYAGMVADVYAQAGASTPVYDRKVFVHNNVIINPEQDRTYAPATRGYVIYFGSGSPALDSGGNKVYQTLAQAGITDTVKWIPGNTSGLYKTADASNPSVATDIFGNPRPQASAKCIGATEAQTATAVAPVNQAPVARAGADTTIVLPATLVTLNGSASSDADGKIVAYAWSMISGPVAALIAGPADASTAISTLVQGAYAFRLQVTDNAGAISADTVLVNVNAAPVVSPAPAVATGTGLRADYYNTNNLSGNIILTRTDATVNFDWQNGSPAAAISTDNFSARWSGQVQAAYSETYTFYTTSDDGVRVWVNGQQLINNWTEHGPVENSGTIALVAGQKYNIVMEYYEKAVGAVARLSWSSPSTPKAIIPQARLYPATAATAGTTAGTGLKGEYYTTNNLSGAVALTRTDATVNFDWVNASPATGIGTDNFSVRWSGKVQAVYTETYTFYTSSDDGVRVWVNGQQIINNWTDHGAIENSGSIALVAGQQYSIVMEYYEKAGEAVAKLSWSGASTPKTIIPQSQLYPAAAAATTAARTMTAVTAVQEPVFIAKAGLAPNLVTAGQPARLTFSSDKGGSVILQLADANGRIVHTQHISATMGINMSSVSTSGISRGMYVVRVLEAGKATSHKLLVQ